AKKAVEYLLSRGHRDIAFLDNFLHGNGSFSECDLRFKAYKEVLNENNIEINPNHIMKACDNYENVFRKCTELFSLDKRPTAVLANDDMHAFVAVSAANSLNLKVPQDIAVIGFDNSSVSKFMIPALTTVEIPKKEISKVSLELLINKIEGKSVKDANLETELIIRKSTN
ncbi:MAG: substrate-binding domain-containing protein, partial [Clostridium sp.]|nr:substrate-binding domain-containing protein [Clostridium sp.]